MFKIQIKTFKNGHKVASIIDENNPTFLLQCCDDESADAVLYAIEHHTIEPTNNDIEYVE